MEMELDLDGYAGINNAIDVINNVCKTLYSKEGVAVARSVNDQDLQNNGFVNNQIYTLGTITSGTYPSRFASSDYIGTNISKAIAWESKTLGYYITDEASVTLGEGNEKSIVYSTIYNDDAVAQNKYLYRANNISDATKLLIYNSTDEEDEICYWLPNISVTPEGKYGIQYLKRFVPYGAAHYYGYVYIQIVAPSYDCSCGARAIVELDADVLVDAGYKLNGGTESNPIKFLEF